MLPIVLPEHMRRAWRRSLSVSLGLTVWITIATSAWAVGRDFGQSVAALLGVGLLSLGLIFPRCGTALYRGWNRLAGTYRWLLRAVTKVLCFHAVLWLMRPAGYSAEFHSSLIETSTWARRVTRSAKPCTGQHVDLQPRSPGDSWVKSYGSWAWQAGQMWACCLIPYLVLLAALDQEVDDSMPSQIYTLF